MQKMIKTVRLSLLYACTLLVASSYPLAAMADTADTPPIETSATSLETTPTTSIPASTPTSDTQTAESTATSSTEEPAKPKETYTYNDDTGHWDSNYWQYNPETGKYERPPEPVVEEQPATQTVPDPTIVTPSTTPQTDASDTTAPEQVTNPTLSDTTKNAITNAIESGALSGDATIKNNTTAGSATSGDASSVATIINSVNSTVTNDNNQKAATFVSDVMGDVSGDIILQPMLLKAMLEAGASSQGSASIETTNQLANDINLGAQSGNATVTGNTTAGSATSGDANTVANVLNIVNSMVSANRSFVGTINIYGNLDGDILIAPDFIPQMLANNGTTSTTAKGSTTVSSKDTQSVVNNIALAAESGKALVSGNTTAGSATSGDADTNIVLFNLSGHDIIASNSLLVFVNVLGKWVGVIVDAPTGATAAAIGNGVTTNTTTSPDLVVDVATRTLLTNNINLTSVSGDATVANNNRAGNATTGNATASANIGNIVGTQLGLSDWFGVLFINVFGSWSGSFGIDTASGSRTVVPGDDQRPPSQSGEQPMRVIDFVPHQNMLSKSFIRPAVTIIGNSGGGHSVTNLSKEPEIQLTSATLSKDDGSRGVLAALTPDVSQSEFQLSWLSGTLVVTGLTLLGASVLSDARKRAILRE